MILYQKGNSVKPYNYDAMEYTNFSYISHLHRDFELIYVIEGELSVTVEDKTTLLRQGGFALILPNQIHSFESPCSNRVFVCVFAADFVREFSRTVGDQRWDENCFYISEEERQFLIGKILSEEPPARMELCAYLQWICAVYYRIMMQKKVPELPAFRVDTLLHRMLEYISQHYTENITLREMAREFGYEEHYLSRCFHNFFQVNFKQFVNEYRIRLACHLLEEKQERSMTEIAFQSGFGSVRNFNRAYRSIMGVEPRRRV